MAKWNQELFIKNIKENCQTRISNIVVELVKFAEVDEDSSFQRLVALRTLNEDKKKIYYIVNMEYLWKKDEPLVLTDEVNTEDKQQTLF